MMQSRAKWKDFPIKKVPQIHKYNIFVKTSHIIFKLGYLNILSSQQQ